MGSQSQTRLSDFTFSHFHSLGLFVSLHMNSSIPPSRQQMFAEHLLCAQHCSGQWTLGAHSAAWDPWEPRVSPLGSIGVTFRPVLNHRWLTHQVSLSVDLGEGPRLYISLFFSKLHILKLLFLLFWLCCVACGILVP